MQGPEGHGSLSGDPATWDGGSVGPESVCSCGQLGGQTSGQPQRQSERGGPVVLQPECFMSSCHAENFLRRGLKSVNWEKILK